MHAGTKTQTQEFESASIGADSGAQLDGIVGRSAPIRALGEAVLKFARHDFTLLIRGESGTGKELIARAVQRNSRRAKGPFVTVNCGALPETLTEALLFGHEKGAFTGAFTDKRGLFETANSGTLFLDEVGELPLSTQVKLLRALQEKEIVRLGASKPIKVDVRVLAATNRDLKQMISQAQFREDLYYRIATLEIEAPPLRNRREDIPELVRHFLDALSRNSQMSCPAAVSDDALNEMARYHWPGNVRELENVVKRLAVIASEGIITAPDVQQALGNSGGAALRETAYQHRPRGTSGGRLVLPPNAGELAEDETFGTFIRRVKLDTLTAAIAQYPDRRAAAERLGLTRQALKRQLHYLRRLTAGCVITAAKNEEER